MNIKFLESMSKIRKRSPDKVRAKSLVDAASATMAVVIEMEPTNSNATIIFRETYECIRQIGDALWWLKGYSPQDHEVSMEILKEEKITNSASLAKLDRFRTSTNFAKNLRACRERRTVHEHDQGRLFLPADLDIVNLEFTIQ